MPHLDPVKRRVVREAVEENLATVRGLPPRPWRRARWVRYAVLRGLLLVLVPALVFVALSIGGGERRSGAPRVPGLAASTPLSFPAPRPIDAATFPLAVKKIVLDPGHGGDDAGASTASGLREKEITLDVGRRLAALLREAAFEVVLTREGDETVSLRQRAFFANVEKADLFVSIHVNAVPARECHAVETFYLGRADDPQIERLAGGENRDSGYSLADFRRLLEGVYTHVRQAESRKLAQVVHSQLVTLLGPTDPALRDLGVKSAPFLVLVATESPAILAEVSCLSNAQEARLLAAPGYRQRIARGLFHGIRAYAETRNPMASRGADR